MKTVFILTVSGRGKNPCTISDPKAPGLYKSGEIVYQINNVPEDTPECAVIRAFVESCILSGHTFDFSTLSPGNAVTGSGVAWQLAGAL